MSWFPWPRLRRFWDSARELPTTELYFSGPLDDLVGRRGPILRLSPNLFSCGKTAVLVRYGWAEELRILRDRRFERVYYILDDNLFALDDDVSLPADYRTRLLNYRNGQLGALRPLLTHIVSASVDILSAFPELHSCRLDPACVHSLPSLVHHRQDRPFRIVFVGTRSHLADFQWIATMLAGFLARHAEAHLTTFLEPFAPSVLQRLDNVRHRPALTWREWKGYVGNHRFHLALAPARPTAFNRARSFSRLFEHAALGAAGLYSASEPFARVIENDLSGILVGDDLTQWRSALEYCLERREATRGLAEGGSRLAATLGSPRRVRDFWRAELGI